MDSQVFLKLIVAAVVVVGIPIAAYAAIAAIRVIWARPVDPSANELARLKQELDVMSNRIADMETQQGRLVELEERLDFAERMLAQRPVRELRRGNTPPEPHVLR